MARVLLVNPHMRQPTSLVGEEEEAVAPSLGLLYIASSLEKNGHDVRVLDMNVSSEPLMDALLRWGPGMVGITALTPQFPEAVEIAAEVKSHDVKTITVIGGAHANACSHAILKRFRQFDYVASGEGEILMEKLASGAPPSAIEGLVFRHGSKIIDNGKTFIRDLDSLPFPARHLVEIGKYRDPPLFYRREPHTTFLSSRGCPFHCTYCDYIARGPYRARSVANVMAEMKQLHSQGFRDLRFMDECFTLDQKRAREMCDMMVEQKFGFSWTCQTRADCFDEITLGKMKKAGCYLIQVGIETGSPRIMKKINKRLDLDRAKLAVRMAKKAGLRVCAFFMLGFPFESREDMKKTIEYAKSTEADIATFTIVTPYPGTELGRGTDFTDLENLKGLLYHSTAGRDAEQFFKEAVHEFYFRPSVVAGILEEALTAGDLKRRVRYADFLVHQLIHLLHR